MVGDGDYGVSNHGGGALASSVTALVQNESGGAKGELHGHECVGRVGEFRFWAAACVFVRSSASPKSQPVYDRRGATRTNTHGGASGV